MELAEWCPECGDAMESIELSNEVRCVSCGYWEALRNGNDKIYGHV